MRFGESQDCGLSFRNAGSTFARLKLPAPIQPTLILPGRASGPFFQ